MVVLNEKAVIYPHLTIESKTQQNYIYIHVYTPIYTYVVVCDVCEEKKPNLTINWKKELTIFIYIRARNVHDWGQPTSLFFLSTTW